MTQLKNVHSVIKAPTPGGADGTSHSDDGRLDIKLNSHFSISLTGGDFDGKR